MERPTYPRINCLVPGCKRGTTRYPPEEDGRTIAIICGPHWRTVPKAWKRRLTLFRRAIAAAERREDERKWTVAARCYRTMWARIERSFAPPEGVDSDTLPAMLAAKLQEEGLL